MNSRRIVGIVALICGIIFIGLSIYIKGQVEEGKVKLSHAESQIDQGKHLLPLNPVTKKIGKEVTKEAETRVEAGKEKIARFEAIAKSLLFGGIVLIAVGGVLFFFPKERTKT